MKTLHKTLIVCILFIISVNVLNAQWVQVPGLGYAFCFTSKDSLLFAGIAMNEGIYRSSDNGASWSQCGLPGIYVQALMTCDTNIFAGTGAGAFRSSDNGASWVEVNNGLPVALPEADIIFSLAAKSSGGGETNIFAGAGDLMGAGGVYRSVNLGSSWTKVNYGLTDHSIFSLLAEGPYIFAGTGNGLFRSANNGTSWTSTNNGLPTSLIYSLASRIPDGGSGDTTIFAGIYSGVYISTDHGSNWSSAGLTGNTVYSLAIVDNYLFAGTEPSGIFFSTDDGTSWTAINEGLTSYGTRGLCVSPPEGGPNAYLLAGFYVNGIWRRPLSELLVSVNEVINEKPAAFYLSQNYPNPFNPSTRIKFSVPVRSSVSLKIYTLLGTEISTLVNETLGSGNYEKVFDGTNLASGVYFCRLQSGGLIQTKKLILQK